MSKGERNAWRGSPMKLEKLLRERKLPDATAGELMQGNRADRRYLARQIKRGRIK